MNYVINNFITILILKLNKQLFTFHINDNLRFFTKKKVPKNKKLPQYGPDMVGERPDVLLSQVYL